MIRGAGKGPGGEPLLFIGLSGENVARLAAGEPIRISPAAMTEMGLPAMEVLLHYGRTEQAIIEEMRGAGWDGQALPAASAP